MKRRQFVMMASGGVLLAATGAATAFVTTRTPQAALQPWRDAGSLYEEPRRRALSYAILAPNPHNRQPWLVDLAGDDQVVLYVDTKRVLPHTDPFNRQITIGLGCFLELMTMAAASDGYRVETELFPEGEDSSSLDARPVARVRFIADAAIAPDPLFAHALERRSLKEPYDLARPVPDAVLASLKDAGRHGNTIDATGNPDHVAALRDLTHRALDIEIRTPHTYKESVDLFRIGKAEIEANPDGIDFGGPLFDTLALLGQFTRETALDTGSVVYAQGIDAVMANVDTAMAHVWLVSNGNNRADQIAAGRDWLRINLAATAAGVGLQPLSQALQEFPEMAGCHAEAHQRLAPDGGTVQMLARLGYAAPVAQSSLASHGQAYLGRSMDDKQAQGMIFGFFNEVGIVSQLSGALFGRLVPQSVHLSHFIVLNHLTRIGDGRTPVQIANALQVTKATMTHTLAVLSGHGFIAMEPHPTDRRSKMVRLTPAGRTFRDEAIDSMSPAFQYLAENISIDELKAVLPVLQKVRRLLDAERDAPIVG